MTDEGELQRRETDGAESATHEKLDIIGYVEHEEDESVAIDALDEEVEIGREYGCREKIPGLRFPDVVA